MMDQGSLTEPELSEEQEIYKENIIDHYRHPHNKRLMKNATVIQKEVNPLCGDKITLYLKLEDDQIVDVSFQGEGCAISQASVSLLTNFLREKNVADAKKISEKDIFTLLGIPISHTRTKCALLSLKTLQRGLRNGLQGELQDGL